MKPFDSHWLTLITLVSILAEYSYVIHPFNVLEINAREHSFIFILSLISPPRGYIVTEGYSKEGRVMSRNHGMPNIWPGYDPNAYPPQDNSPQYDRNGMMMQNGASVQQYQMGGAMQQDQRPYWNPNVQLPYNMPTTGYAPDNFRTAPSPASQYYQPQPQHHPQPPVQVQVQIPQPIQQQYPLNQRAPQHRILPQSNMPMEQMNPQVAHTKPPTQLDYPLLLISLAEEYFGAAHELAPAVAIAMTEENIHAYHKLITMGLECLTIALKQLKLPARLEAKVRLRIAGIIYEETNNYAEAESMLSQGIILCERV